MKSYLNTNFNYDDDQLVSLYDELPLWAAPFGLKLLDQIKIKRNITALDIGFGAGFPLLELAMRLGKSSLVYGIDPWKGAVRRTLQKIEFYGISNVELIEGGAEVIPLANESIDLITSNNGINNVQDQDKVLNECFRVLKQGGQFVQTMNLDATMIEFYQVLEKVLYHHELVDCLKNLKDQIYTKRRPLEEFIKHLSSKGFKITKVIHDQFNYKFADGSTMLNHYFIRLAFMDGWKSIVPEEYKEIIFSEVENAMNKKAENGEEFQLSVPFVVIDCTKE